MRVKCEKMAETENSAAIIVCTSRIRITKKNRIIRFSCMFLLLVYTYSMFFLLIACVNYFNLRLYCFSVLAQNPLRTLYRYILSLLITLCVFQTGTTQQIDSLVSLLKKPNLPDTVFINANNNISRQLSFVKPIEALDYTQKAMERSLKIQYKKGIAESYRNLASIYSHYGSYYLTVFNIQKAIEGYKELNDSIGLANCYISLGHMYRYLKNTPQEITYHKLSFEIHSRFGDPERIGVTAHNLGESYFNNKEIDKAKELTQRAIILNDSIHNIQVLSSCYKVMGKILMSEKNLNEAEVYFKKILQIYDSLKDNSQKIATIEAFVELAAIYRERENTSKEEFYLQEAAKFVLHYKLTNYTRQIYLDLIELYEETNRKDKAIEYTKKFRQVSESLAKIEMEDKNQLVAGFTKLYQVEKQNSILEIENTLKDEREKRKNILLFFIGGFSVLTIILLFILVRNLKKIRITNEQLEQKNMIIESQNEKLEELNQTKDKFFGIVSHDLRAPLIAVSSFTDFMLSGQLKNIPEEQINELVAESKTLIDNARKLTDDLITWAQLQMQKEEANPVQLSAAELVQEVMTVYEDAAEKKQIRITHSIDPELKLFADKNQYSFIIRNLINNALKFTHSGGSIHISGTRNGNNTSIAISDTGTGMSKDAADSIFRIGKMKSKNGTAGEKGTGLGLILVQEFVRLNKGEINVSSELGKGSTFTVSIPSSK